MSEDETAVIGWGYDGSCDRPISLIDTTNPREVDTAGTFPKGPSSPSRRMIANIPTRGLVREGLARRKYAKWQADRYAFAPGLNAHSESENENTSPYLGPSSSLHEANQDRDRQRSAPDHEFLERGRKRLQTTEEAMSRGQADIQPHEIDVLYENQRGWFFFGIPLYSHSSLLNFDPGPWMTKDGKNSAVNITNAQLPNPSWQWAWKSWYVDMSHDVDEEGWQYSLSFSTRFSWHGTHPWFHCFVRRRRWLRKRVMRPGTKSQSASNLQGPHTLNNDYFTIHTTRRKSPGSPSDNSAIQESSVQSQKTTKKAELPPEDVKNIPSLMKALRLAVIDREKIDAVKRFVETGGDELVYLEQHVPEIMRLLVFQTSRMQLLESLSLTAKERAEGSSNAVATRQHMNHLHKAMSRAVDQMNGLGYWSDRQHVLGTVDESQSRDETSLSESSLETVHPVEDIKGIPGEAEVGVDHTKPVVDALPMGKVDSINLDSARAVSESRSQRSSVHETMQRDEKGDEVPESLPPDSVKVND